ncbi:MAG: hypothetical protein CM15mP77_1870 [Synechococcus sp.]|nr:MAG: hypothetical protein CM15mP77_1870 [Synechococcus sp.]
MPGIGRSLPGSVLRVNGVLEISNPHPRMEVFVPELQVLPTLLGKADLSALTVTTRIQADHPDEAARADGYWAAYIVRAERPPVPGCRSRSLVVHPWSRSTRSGPMSMDQLRPVRTSGAPAGVPVPLRCPEPLRVDQAAWQSGDRCSVLPLKTHLLGPLDDPIDVLRRYAAPLLQPGMYSRSARRPWP